MTKGKPNKGRIKNADRAVGRPRQKGERHPCGKLKQSPKLEDAGANERILAERRWMLGDASLDLSLASDPLNLAHARGWLSTRRHRAGVALQATRRRAGLSSPGLSGSSNTEADAPVVDLPRGAAISNLTKTKEGRRELHKVWDSVFNKGLSPEDPEIAAAKAMKRWQAMMKGLTAMEALEVNRVCVHAAWPTWLQWRISNPDAEQPPEMKRRKRLLEAGLDKIAEELWPSGPQPVKVA